MKMFQFMIFPNYTEMFDKIDGFIRDYDECLLILPFSIGIDIL